MARRASRRSSGARRAPRDAWLYLLLALPRIVRTLYPQLWIEDDFYLESAFLVSAGMRPYLDFVHPHMPLLEWLSGAYLKLFGAGHLSLEILNQAAIYLANIFTYLLARRAAGRRAAVMAALLFAFSALGFRYHVYERECFVAPLVLLAALAVSRHDLKGLPLAVRLAALFTVACAIKLTAAVALLAILAHLAIARRRLGDALLTAAGFALALGAFSALLYTLYGFEFFFQTFLFHLLKGRLDPWSVAAYPLAILDVFVPLAILGAVRLASMRPLNHSMQLVVAVAAAEYLFFGVLSPTAWGHNYLEALPYIAIIAGVGLDAILAALRAVATVERPSRAQWSWLIGASAAVIVSLIWFAPLVNENWLRGSVYGFGFVPRAEVRLVGEEIRRASAPGHDVVAPALLCFEARRPSLIRYPETYGVYREALATYDRIGLSAARRRLGKADFFALIADTSGYWTDLLARAITSGTLTVVVPDSPILTMPLVHPRPDLLLDNQFVPSLRTRHFTVWSRQSGPASSQID